MFAVRNYDKVKYCISISLKLKGRYMFAVRNYDKIIELFNIIDTIPFLFFIFLFCIGYLYWLIFQ